MSDGFCEDSEKPPGTRTDPSGHLERPGLVASSILGLWQNYSYPRSANRAVICFRSPSMCFCHRSDNGETEPRTAAAPAPHTGRTGEALKGVGNEIGCESRTFVAYFDQDFVWRNASGGPDLDDRASRGEADGIVKEVVDGLT